MANYKKHQYQMIIKEHHLDTFHHVNNATYLQILEEARWELLQAGGFGLNLIHERKTGPVVLECHIKFLKELRLRQTITIESQIQSYEKKIAVIQQEIFNEQHERCCQATMTFGFFDMKQRKLISPSNEWLIAIGVNHDESV